MENRDRPSFDGSADDGGRESSGGEERKAPAPIKKDDDFAEEFPSELPRMPPNASLPSAAASASRPILNDHDAPDFADDYVRKLLEHAPSIEPMRPPGRRMVGSLERPPVVSANNHDVSPGAFPVFSTINTATSRASSVPTGVYDSSRGLANEATKQDEWLSDSTGAGASAPGRDLHAVEAQLVPEETTMIAEAQPIPEESMMIAPVPPVRMKWYQRRWINLILALSACGFVGVVIVLVVVLSRQAAAASSSSLLPPTPAPTTGTPSTKAPISAESEQIACYFLSISNVTECRSTLRYNAEKKPTGSTIPSEIGLLTQLTYLDVYNNTLSGSIPSEIGLLTRLSFLSFSSSFNNENDRTTGSTIPSEIGLLTLLTDLRLFDNQLSGTIPSEIGLLTQLARLYLYDNQLSGTIPSSLCSHVKPLYIDCGVITCQQGCCICCVGC